MKAKIICVCNQKGGSGKTTVAMHLGGTLSIKNKTCLIIDGDEQGSAVEWASMAPEGTPFPAKICSLAKAGKKIHQEIKKFRDDYDYIIIDCPPAADSPVAKSSLLVSDLALVPFIPGALDMLAAILIRDTIEDIRILNPNLKSKLVLNRVEPNTNLTQSVLDAIPDFKMEVMESRIHKRTAYGEAVLAGTIVHKMKKQNQSAINEIENLTQEVIKTLDN
jgi:chromosome partitioning protein